MEEHIKNFEDTFGAKIMDQINMNKMPIIEMIFERFGDELYVSSERCNDLRTENSKIIEKLESTFSEEQQKLFEQYWENYNEMITDADKQLFMFGYCVALELQKEGKTE